MPDIIEDFWDLANQEEQRGIHNRRKQAEIVFKRTIADSSCAAVLSD
jgi:hypothetical protein